MMGKMKKLNNLLLPSRERPFDLWDHSIILGYRGSIVHGTYIADNTLLDDKDVMGICIPPLEYYLGMKKFEQFERLPEQEDREDPWDVVIYEFHKFMRLLIKSNPNVMSLLWLPKEYIIKIHPLGERLIANRHLFVTKAAYHSFSGYAYGQLKRMTAMATHWRMGAKRKALVEKYGYDTKNASHLIRLLRMGIEFLTDGELHVVRKDASQLIQIKRGDWPLDKVHREADRLFKQCEEAYVRSSLPDKPDREAVMNLAFEITQGFLSDRHNNN